MSIRSVVADVGSVAAYPSTPQVALEFLPDYFIMRIESGTPAAYVSFDGIEDHWMIKPADVPFAIPTHAKFVWVREASVGACTVRVTGLTRS